MYHGAAEQGERYTDEGWYRDLIVMAWTRNSIHNNAIAERQTHEWSAKR